MIDATATPSSNPDDGPARTVRYSPCMARRNSTELASIPIVLVGLGALFAVLYAANVGPIVFVVVVAVALAAVVALAVALAHRANREDAFEGAAAPATDGVHRVLVVTDGPWLVPRVPEPSPRGFDPRSPGLFLAPPVSPGARPRG